MKTVFSFAGVLAIVFASVLAAQSAQAEEKCTVSDMHVCCKGCVMAIEKAGNKVPGCKCTASEDDAATTITADSKESLQKAVDAIAAAGFCGTCDNPQIKFAPISAPSGKVQKLEVSHVHNCCGKCTEAMKDAIKEVPGITSNTLQNKKTTFTVEGDFSADDLVKALEKAGFYPQVK